MSGRGIHRIKEISVDISKDYADINIVRDEISYDSCTRALDIQTKFPNLSWQTLRDIIEASDKVRLIEEEVDTLFYHDDGCNIKVTEDDETLFTYSVNLKTKLEIVK
jgi:hypothetical protein